MTMYSFVALFVLLSSPLIQALAQEKAPVNYGVVVYPGYQMLGRSWT
jgi:hypothetical protein